MNGIKAHNVKDISLNKKNGGGEEKDWINLGHSLNNTFLHSPRE